MIAVRRLANLLIWAMVALLSAAELNGQKSGAPVELGKLSGPQMENACALEPEYFSLKKQYLTVYNMNGAVLFTSCMTIHTNVSPNAYYPNINDLHNSSSP